MRGSNFARAEFRNVSMRNANLSLAYLCDSVFEGVCLEGADLKGCLYPKQSL